MRTGYDQEKTQAPEGAAEGPEVLRRLRTEAFADCETARPRSSAEILREVFSYHPPTPTTLPKFAAINQAAKNFAEILLQNCPSSEDRRVALNCIRNARMFANASIALDGLSL
jgi:hypothetical protein